MFSHRVRRSRGHGCRTHHSRRGVETLEFAMVLPLIMMLGLGIVEFSRAMTVQQILTNAAREGAREAVLPDSSVAEVRDLIAANVRTGRIDPNAVEVTLNPASLSGVKSGVTITVNLQVPYGDVSWVPMPKYLANAVLSSECAMRHE